jgi:trans-aconitate 2-methyltransferase
MSGRPILLRVSDAVVSTSKEWDADAYHRLADPQFAWGQALLRTLELSGDETVIDAGCGTGRLTRLLLERLPRGRVIALDVSDAMLERARANLEPDFGDRVSYLPCDLLDLAAIEVADVVFSTATFHWVPDHPRLFGNLARALRPGGRQLAQFGGKGNLDRVRSRAERVMAEPAYAPYFEGWIAPWHYPDEVSTAERLREAGFREVETSRFAEPTTFLNPDTFRQFIATVIFRVHLLRIPDARLREEFLDRAVAAAAQEDPPYTLDYWRLNARASRR